MSFHQPHAVVLALHGHALGEVRRGERGGPGGALFLDQHGQRPEGVPPPDGLEPSYTPAEIAAALKKAVQFVYDECNSGRLKARRIGVELRILKKDFEDYLDQSTNTGPSPLRHPRPTQSVSDENRDANPSGREALAGDH